MKINEVEARVGITRKNIRFYEEQGLLHPERNSSNGYRDYSEAEVELLRKIKLLRRLDIPLEEIRRLLEGKQSLQDCLDRHSVTLRRQARRVQCMQELCEELRSEGAAPDAAAVERYLSKMDELEQGGPCFMNVQKSDIGKKKRSAVIAGLFMILLMAVYIGIILWASHGDPIPLGLLVLLICIPAVVIIGIVLALRQRMKEIQGGEEDEASKY